MDMEDDNVTDDEHDSSEETEASPKKPKPRGQTTGIRAAKKKGPRHISFDENNVPTGVWKKDFATEMGVRARHITITFQKWKLVPGGKKETIWKHVKKKYNIKDDTYKEVVIRIVSSRFKDFKSRLRGIFIYKTRKPSNKKEELGDPLLIYKQISKEEWAEFEKQANDPEFKAKSDKARESQKENKCPHYMGRAGYAGKKDEWFDDELTKLKEVDPEIDPNAVEEMVTECFKDRSFTWMKGHTPKSSDPPLPTQEVFEGIRHWRGLQATGEFVPTGSDDVLVKATGKRSTQGEQEESEALLLARHILENQNFLIRRTQRQNLRRLRKSSRRNAGLRSRRNAGVT